MIGVFMALSILGAQSESVQSCGMELGKWVCRTHTPPTIPADSFNRGLANGAALGQSARPRTEVERQAMLRRCGSTRWWQNLCTPAEESEGRALIEADKAKSDLKAIVTTLLSEDRCPEAVRTALAAGDMDLAREARDFCRGD